MVSFFNIFILVSDSFLFFKYASADRACFSFTIAIVYGLSSSIIFSISLCLLYLPLQCVTTFTILILFLCLFSISLLMMCFRAPYKCIFLTSFLSPGISEFLSIFLFFPYEPMRVDLVALKYRVFILCIYVFNSFCRGVPSIFSV